MDDQKGTEPQAATPQGTDEADVEGHMHPHTAIDLNLARQQERLAEAEQARLVRSAQRTERDGGMLAKLRRLGRRDD